MIKTQLPIHPLFIIEGDRIIIGKVNDYPNMCKKKRDIKCGGFYRCSRSRKEITFYGYSQEFGAASIDMIKRCVNQNSVYAHRLIQPLKGFVFLFDTGKEIVYIGHNF